jgi:PKD repeat protein
MRDALLGDTSVTTQIFYYGGGVQHYTLNFLPPLLTGESYTQGYYPIGYIYSGGTWQEVWRMTDAYPPRLRVISRYALTINSYGSGTTSPAPGYYRVYREGSNVVVTAIPSAGWEFYHWGLDGVDVGSSNPYTVTMDNNHVLTAVFIKPLTWSTTIVPVPGAGIIPFSPNGIAVNSLDNPAIIYGQNWRLEPPWNRYVFYVNHTNQGWDHYWTDFTSWCDDASIVVDSRDIPQIACAEQYYNVYYPRVEYGNWTGTNFDVEMVYEATGDYSHYAGVSLAVDSLDQPYIAFSVLTLPWPDAGGLMLATKEPSGTWSLETVDSEYNDPDYEDIMDPAIALDSNDYPRIIYSAYKYQDTYELRYAKWNGLEWSIDIIDSHPYLEGGFGGLDIALDSEDHPHVVYAGVDYAWFDGSTWNHEQVDSGDDVSLALDSLDRPHISYHQYPNVLRYAWRLPTNYGNLWVKQIVDSECSSARSTSIALDSLGNPHISYQNETWIGDIIYWRLKYATPSTSNHAPVADANGPYIEAGVPIVFDGSGSFDLDGIIVSYEWDFGDGSSSTGVSPSHTYAQAGSYTVTLTVIDDSGAKATDATTAITRFTITASAGTGGTISPSGSVTVNYGDDVTFAVTADPGYGIQDVVVDGTDHRGGIPSYTFYHITADHSISASFGISDHDIAVIDVTPSKTSVGSGYAVQIDATVESHGFFTESFNLTVYYGNSAITVEQWETFWRMGDVNRDGYINMTDMNLLDAAFYTEPGDPNWNPWADLNQDLIVDINDLSICAHNNGLEIWTYTISGGVIGTLPVINLAAGNTQTLAFAWDTSGMPYGNYVTCSYAVPILGKEVDRADNTFVDGAILVTIPGDIDGDKDVDGIDFGIFAPCYGSFAGQPAYNAVADIDGDGDVDGVDFGIFAPNYGKSW